MHQCFNLLRERMSPAVLAQGLIIAFFAQESCIRWTQFSWDEIQIKPLDVLCLRAWMAVYETHFGSHPLPGEIAIFTEDNFPFIL